MRRFKISKRRKHILDDFFFEINPVESSVPIINPLVFLGGLVLQCDVRYNEWDKSVGRRYKQETSVTGDYRHLAKIRKALQTSLSIKSPWALQR